MVLTGGFIVDCRRVGHMAPAHGQFRSNRSLGLSFVRRPAVGCHLDLNANSVLLQILASVIVKA